MSDELNISNESAERIARAIAATDPSQRLRAAKAGMSDRIRDTARAKREEREQAVGARLFDRRLRELQRERGRNES